MANQNDQDNIEATEEQLAELRDLGATESDLGDLSYDDAEDLIAELLALREDAGRFGRS